MGKQLNLNNMHAVLSVPMRFSIASFIFLLALLLRYWIWPIESGLAFVTFYPAVFLTFYLCGAKPGFLVTTLSAFSAFYIFLPPFWTFPTSVENYVAVVFFLFSSWFMGYIVTKGHYWQKQLINTERHKIEEINKQLLTASELLTLTERSVSAGAWRWDMNSDKMFWSDQLFMLFGLDPENDDPSFNSWRKIVHPDDRQKAEKCIRDASRNLEPLVTSYRVNLPTGNIRWIDAYGGPIYDKLGKPIEFSGICVNSTSLHIAEQQIQESERRFRNMFTNLTVGYQAFDINGRWLDANQKMADTLGFKTPEEMIGQSFSDFWPDTNGQFDTFYKNFMDNNYIDGEFNLTRRDGQPITVIISGRIQRSNEGDFLRAHSAVVDITERQKMEQKIIELNTELELKVAMRTAELSKANEDLQHLSRHDALTGLHNRLSADERLHTEFISTKRTWRKYAILMLDIDLFKHVNDTHGHAVGDNVLQQIAQTLKVALRESDFVSRYGGEEFLLLLPNTEIEEAYLVAEKIRHAIESSPHPVAGKITVSIGLAIATPEQSDEYVAVKESDDWLYAAKKAGRNCTMPTENNYKSEQTLNT